MKKILIVDDEEDILELVRYNLSREGFSVACAATEPVAPPAPVMLAGRSPPWRRLRARRPTVSERCAMAWRATWREGQRNASASRHPAVDQHAVHASSHRPMDRASLALPFWPAWPPTSRHDLFWAV